MKYQVNQVEVNPDDDETIIAVIRKIAVFERLQDAEEYIEFLYSCDDDDEYRIFDENNTPYDEF